MENMSYNIVHSYDVINLFSGRPLRPIATFFYVKFNFIYLLFIFIIEQGINKYQDKARQKKTIN